MRRRGCPRPKMIGCKLEPSPRGWTFPPISEPGKLAMLGRTILGGNCGPAHAVIYLNHHHCPVGFDRYDGRIGEVHAGEILRGVLLSGASAFVIAESSPCEKGIDSLDMLQFAHLSIKRAGEITGLRMLDTVAIRKDSYYSLSQGPSDRGAPMPTPEEAREAGFTGADRSLLRRHSKV